ncbi:MAG: putative dehydrogenase [Acidobacteria bacterium]|nr:putative dehydrogenase [Acidobacteriota bacterium]
MNARTALIWLLAMPLVASAAVYLLGRVGVRAWGSAAPARWLAALALGAAGVPLWVAGREVLASGAVSVSVGEVGLRMDGVGLLLAGTVLALTFVVTLFSVPYMRGEEGEEKYYALLVAMAASMIGLGCADDLFNLWVWFEAMAVTSFLLVAFYREQKASLEAGVKYLVQSAVGSAFVLIGIALVFGRTGTLRLSAILAAVSATGATPGLLAAGGLFLIGFGVKTALVPLHTWLPDAHSMAPSGISAMLSGVVIEAGLVAMLRSLGALAAVASTWGALILAFGALNMIVGNLMALRQTQVKRLLAYSSVSHMGYMLLGFGVAVGYGIANGAAGGFFHLANHAVMKGLAFLAVGALLYSMKIARGSHEPLMVQDLDGASNRYPVTAFALSVAVLALGGLPPLSGFMSKWQIMVAGFETRNPGVELLVIFAALNSVLSLAYYAPLVNRMYRNEPSPAVAAGKPVTFLLGAPLVALTLVVVALGMWPGLADFITGPAGDQLVSIFAGPPAWGN